MFYSRCKNTKWKSMKISDCCCIYGPRAHCWELLDVFASEHGLKAAVGCSFLACILHFQINIYLISFNPISDLLSVKQKTARSLPARFSAKTKPHPNLSLLCIWQMTTVFPVRSQGPIAVEEKGKKAVK